MNFVPLVAIIGSPLLYSTSKGEWVVGQFYRIGDIVGHAEATYLCKTEHISAENIEPGHKPRYWELYGV